MLVLPLALMLALDCVLVWGRCHGHVLQQLSAWRTVANTGKRR